MSSEAVQEEIDGDPSLSRRARVQESADLAKRFVVVEIEQLTRALELRKLGFGPFDALHIACAEHAREKLKVKAANPITWLLNNLATLDVEVIE